MDGHVRGVVHPVDVDQRARGVGEIGDRADRWPGAHQVGRGGQRHEPGAGREDRGDVVLGELGRPRIELGPADGRPDGRGGHDPRPDVRVVVETGDDHLVACRPGRGERARHGEGELGHAAAEDHAAGVHAEQVGHRGAGGVDDGVGRAFCFGDRSAVGQRERRACAPPRRRPRPAPGTRRARRSARSPPSGRGTGRGGRRRRRTRNQRGTPNQGGTPAVIVRAAIRARDRSSRARRGPTPWPMRRRCGVR